MTAKEQIRYLEERVRQADFDMRVRDAVLQEFLDQQKEYDKRLSKLDCVLSDVEDINRADLTAKLKYADKFRFGDKLIQ